MLDMNIKTDERGLIATYHYTPARNIKSIMEKGLLPKPVTKMEILDNPDVKEWGLKKMKYIWVWKRIQSAKSNAGNLILKLANFKATKVALLRVWVTKKEIRCWPMGVSMSGSHDGFLNKQDGTRGWIFHTEEPSWILRYRVPPERIEIVKIYDIVKLLDDKP
jgi:hypothetical protein